MQPEITDAADRSRWEAHLDGELAGFAEYQRRGSHIVFPHTVVDPSFEGRGVGSALVRSALDAARAAGERVVPLCPFFATYIERHPEYDELVDHDLYAALLRRVEE